MLNCDERTHVVYPAGRVMSEPGTSRFMRYTRRYAHMAVRSSVGKIRRSFSILASFDWLAASAQAATIAWSSLPRRTGVCFGCAFKFEQKPETTSSRNGAPRVFILPPGGFQLI